MPGQLLQDEPADGVLRLTITNPARRNALDHAILDGIAEAVGALDDDARCVLVTGAGGMFSSGYDLGDLAEEAFADEAEQLVAHPFTAALDALDACPVPTLAALPGHTIGGGLELALACDLRVAAHEARLGLPEAGLGLLPGAGGTQRLTRLCGQGVAKRLILGAEVIDGIEAARLGIVQWAVPRADLAVFARDLAQRHAAIPRAALAANKRCIAAAGDCARDGYAEELRETRLLYDHPETRCRVSDFLARRAR